MPREFAAVNVSIWSDEDWRSLPPLAQHLYLTLWTDPKLSYCGVLDWRPGRIAARAAGWTADDVRTAADCLRARHFIVTDEDTEECLIRSWVRWDGLMKQPRMAVSYAHAYATVESTLLRRVLVHELVKLHERHPDLAGFSKPAVQEMLHLPAVSAKVSVSVEDPFGPSLAQTLPDVSVPPTPFSFSNSNSSTPDSIQKPPRPVAVVPDRPEFDRFWKVYPNTAKKVDARKAYEKALKKTTHDVLFAGAENAARAWAGPDKQYAPHAATWLNGERWTEAAEQMNPRLGVSQLGRKQQETDDMFGRAIARAQARDDVREQRAIGQ